MFIRKAVCLLLNQIAAFDKIWCKGVDIIVWTTTKAIIFTVEKGHKTRGTKCFLKIAG